MRPVLVGERLTHVEGSAPAVRARSASLIGRSVEGIRTIGKHLVVDADGGMSIHVHLGMPGRVRVTGPTSGPTARERGAVRVALGTDRGTVWILSAPTVDVDRRPRIDRSLARLGPDVLAEHFEWERFEQMAARFPPDRTVSDFLLEQRVLAGVGNEYKCEVLFLEGVSPGRLAGSVDADRRRALVERARRIMLPNAHRSERSTTGRRDAPRWVFQRTGRPCRRCRTAIVEEWIGRPPRITYWCPSCQA